MLQLEHTDGNNLNNELTNLEIVCPNCHSQTPTFAGCNTRKHFGPKELSEAVKAKRKARIDLIESKKKKILESDIDFSRFGWVEKVSQIIGITPQRTRNWMKNNLPQIQCHKRKPNIPS